MSRRVTNALSPMSLNCVNVPRWYLPIREDVRVLRGSGQGHTVDVYRSPRTATLRSLITSYITFVLMINQTEGDRPKSRFKSEKIEVSSPFAIFYDVKLGQNRLRKGLFGRSRGTLSSASVIQKFAVDGRAPARPWEVRLSPAA